MKSKIAFPVMLAILLFIAARTGWAAEPAPGLLLRCQLRWELEELGAVSEALIYRDGLVVVRGVFTKGFDLAFISRGVAATAALEALKRQLGEKRIGAQVATDCLAVNPFPTGADFHAVLTWFGRDSRQNRLEFSNAGLGDPEPCNSDINSIFLGVHSFLADVPYSDRVQTLP